jgi:hypothetical protein
VTRDSFEPRASSDERLNVPIDKVAVFVYNNSPGLETENNKLTITKEVKKMNVNLMSRIGIIGFICLAITLGLAGVSYADLPKVIGNWEDSNDDWVVHPEAAEGTTARAVKENATLGNYSYKVFVPSGWQKAITRDLSGDAHLLEDLGKATQLKIDVTLKTKEWNLGTGWVKAVECIVIQDNFGDWQQIDPTGNPEDISWNGQDDKTVTAAFEIPAQTPPDLTRGSVIIITNYGDVNAPGSFYFDNVRLVGAAGETKPAEMKKAAEPNKPKEAAKPAEPKKPSEPNKPAK